MHGEKDSTRRQFLGLAGGAAVLGTVPIVTLRPAEATPAMLASAIRTVTGGAAVKTGKIKLDVPPLVENGNTVRLSDGSFWSASVDVIVTLAACTEEVI